MKKKKAFISLVCIFACIMLALGIFSLVKNFDKIMGYEATNSSSFLFKGSQIVGYTGSETEIVLPKSYSINEDNRFVEGEDIQVDSIAAYAFQDSDVKKITVLTNITKFEQYAFNGCDTLKEIRFQNGITEIQESMFEGCLRLEKAELPTSVTKIGANAFNKCISLKEVNIPDSIKVLEEGTFRGCENLESVNLNNITQLKDYAFYGCRKLSNINTSNITYIGQAAFSHSNIQKFDARKITEIPFSCFSNCENLVSISFNNNLKSIGYRAFYGCLKLDEIDLPDTITILNEETFMGCKNLKTIKLSSNLKIIGAQAFCDTGLLEIQIPGTLTALATNVFKDCKYLDLVIIDSQYIYNNVLTDEACGELVKNASVIKVLKTVDDGFNTYLSDYNKFIKTEEQDYNVYARGQGEPPVDPGEGEDGEDTGEYTPSPISYFEVSENEIVGYKGNATEIVLPTSYSIVDGKVVEGNDILLEKVTCNFAWTENANLIETIVVPEGYTTIGEFAFSNISNLNKIVIADSVTNIETSAFSNNQNLTYIKLPSNLKTISQYMLENCPNLTEIDLPGNIETIKENAFYGSGIKSFDLPDTIKTIETKAFGNCLNLKSITLPGVTEIQSYTFSGCINLIEVVFSSGTQTIKGNAFYSCYLLRSIVLSDTLTTIEPLAFSYVQELSEIEINSKEIYINSSNLPLNQASVVRVLKSIDDSSNTYLNQYFTKTSEGDYNVYSK